MFTEAFPILSTSDVGRAAAGVAVVQEPADQPLGERMAIVTDPDGNRVIVGQHAT